MSVLLVFAQCQKGSLNAQEFKQWMKDNKKLVQVREMQEYEYRIQYVPSEWILHTSGVNAEELSKVENGKSQKQNLLYFKLEIDVLNGKENLLKKNVAAADEYYTRLYYVSYKFKDDISMKSAGVTYPCKLYSYERAYDLNSRLQFMIAFECPVDIQDDVQIDIRPKFYSDERIKFLFNKQTIISVPKLVI